MGQVRRVEKGREKQRFSQKIRGRRGGKTFEREGTEEEETLFDRGGEPGGDNREKIHAEEKQEREERVLRRGDDVETGRNGIIGGNKVRDERDYPECLIPDPDVEKAEAPMRNRKGEDLSSDPVMTDPNLIDKNAN